MSSKSLSKRLNVQADVTDWALRSIRLWADIALTEDLQNIDAIDKRLESSVAEFMFDKVIINKALRCAYPSDKAVGLMLHQVHIIWALYTTSRRVVKPDLMLQGVIDWLHDCASRIDDECSDRVEKCWFSVVRPKTKLI